MIGSNNLLILNSERRMNFWLHGSLLPSLNMLSWDAKTTPMSCTGFTKNILLHWQKEESLPSTMHLLRLKVLIRMKLMMMTMTMERMVLVYASSLMVQLKASEAKGTLHRARTSKCAISSTWMVTLLMAGEQQKYAVMQGQSSSDLPWTAKFLTAGSMAWMWQAVTIIATIW